MNFKCFAGTAIIPTLSRLVLAVAFVTVGWNKLVTDAEFSADEKTVLESYGIAVTTITSAAAVPRPGERQVVLATWRQDEPSQNEPGRAAEEKTAETSPPVVAPPTTPPAAPPGASPPVAAPPVTTPPATTPPAATPPVTTPPVTTPPVTTPAVVPPKATPAVGVPGPVTPMPGAAGDVYLAKSMYRITLLCDRAGWPMPKWSARVAAGTEFLGGCMLLLGFLSRVWGLGLSIAMASAFCLVSMNIYGVHTTNPFTFAQDIGKFNTVFNQLGLFVLAFGILLTGPGPLSLDRIIFRPKSSEDDYDDDGDHVSVGEIA